MGGDGIVVLEDVLVELRVLPRAPQEASEVLAEEASEVLAQDLAGARQEASEEP